MKNYIVDKESVIESGTEIGAGCVITKSTIKAGAVLLPYSIVSESVVESGATVGPFSYIRPGCVISKNAKVGAFVEVKKSEIGEGSKVPHLSYVGDAEIGKYCNIGCGVVVCNYDGKNKHKTIIGNNCFVGSNVNLIAPIEIEHGAFIAAGSTINNKVGKNEFAIARAKQENKEMPSSLMQNAKCKMHD